MPETKSLRVWDASEGVPMLIDFQDHVLDVIFAQDRRVIELNVRTLTKMAVALNLLCSISTSACLAYPVMSALKHFPDDFGAAPTRLQAAE